MSLLCFLKLSVIFHYFVIITLLVSSGFSYMVGNNPHHLRENLDPEGNYQLEWIVDSKEKIITFNVTARTTGYVGFGLSANGKMTGADIVIGGVDSRGKTYFADYHAVGHQTPVRDPRQDWELLSGHENGTHTFLTFSKTFDTCDPQDYAITEDKISIIWALGTRDEVRYHCRNRGVFHVYLLHPDYSPQIITEPGTGIQRILDEHGNLDMSINVWTVNREMAVPTQETLYWCTMHRAPPLRKKNHIIGFNVRVHDEPSFRHVHHFVIYRCNAPRGGTRDARTMFDAFVGSRGQACLNVREPTGPMPTEYCTDFVQLWAVGGRSHFHPPHVAFSLENDSYYIFQLHLDNPTFIPNTRINVSADFFYTEKLRPNEGGFMSVRHEIPGLSPSLFVPPHSPEYQIRGICGTKCSQEMFPPEGISVYGTLLHTHNAGRRMRVRHFRNNRELPLIAFDENYSFFYQQEKNIPREVRILPGDQLVAECVYDSTLANGTVVGGFSSSQEMCSMMLLHYQKLVDIQQCSSQITSIQDRRYFLAGVENITFSNNHIEFVVDPPHRLAGLTISEVSDNHVDWTLERREEIRRYHLYRPHTNACQMELWTLGPNPVQKPGTPVTYPYGATPYLQDNPCSPHRASR